MLSRASYLPIAGAFLAVLLVCLGLYQTPLLDAPRIGSRPDYVLKLQLPAPGEVDLPSIAGSGDASRPLVVIDAGHGGHDTGAISGNRQEKDIVLSLAKRLRDELLADGRVRVALTREDDRFLVLEERAEIARRLDADLFLSIHADSAGDITEAAGASIYTLSADASSQAAARYAARENSADIINGVHLERGNETVATILVELSQRRAVEEAGAFAQAIEEAGTGRIAFREPARRSAPFVVLKAPDIPSVLFEAGFISNAAEAQVLDSAEGRERFAEIMARAILNYFDAAPPAQDPEPASRPANEAPSARPSIGSVL